MTARAKVNRGRAMVPHVARKQDLEDIRGESVSALVAIRLGLRVRSGSSRAFSRVRFGLWSALGFPHASRFGGMSQSGLG